MSTHTVDRLHVAVLDGHLMDDATLGRLVPECRSLTAFTTGRDESGLAQRWAALAPETELIDGGHVADLREAMVECAKRRIVVISTGVPKDPPTFVAHALQGAAAMTEFEIPGVAVHVMRPVERPGTVAWLTDTGEFSGYGVLFAVGYAHLHGTGLDLIEPTGGLDRPRTAQALDDALAFAESAGVPITRHTDPSPFARVLRDKHCLVVHPVLDAPKGFNLLHPGELSRKAVAKGNPAAAVELIEQFPGDVVAVFDGVHLTSGSVPAARIAAGVALGVVGMAGIGTMLASPASASTLGGATGNTAVVSVEGDWFRAITDVVSGLSLTAGAHSGSGTSLVIHNSSGHTVTLQVTGFHGHGGGEAFQQPVTVTAGQSVTVQADRGGVKRWGLSVITSIDGHQVPHIQVTGDNGSPIRVPPSQIQDIVQQLTPVVITGTDVTTQSLTVVERVVVAEPSTETVLEAIVPNMITPPPLTIPTPTDIDSPSVTVGEVVPGPEVKVDVPVLATPGGAQTPVADVGGVSVELQQQVTPQVDVVTPTVGVVTETPGGAQTPVADVGGVSVELQQQVTPQVDVVTPTVGVVTETPGGAQTPVADVGGVSVELQQQVTPQVDVVTPTVGVVTETPGGAQTPVADVGGVSVELQQQVTPQVNVVGPTVGVATRTPDTLLELGGPGITSGATTDVTMPPIIGTPGNPDTITTGDHGPTTQTTHHQTTHHTTPSGLVDGTEHQAPQGELAHTGGSTAILAIVAGSLIAAGAGLAVAGRMGKTEEDDAAAQG